MCVMCSRLLCPYLVCFLSLFTVIISEVCSSHVCLINLCIEVPVCSVSCGLVYSLLPGVPVCVSLALFVYIKDYYLSLLLVSVFLYPPRVCAPWHVTTMVYRFQPQCRHRVLRSNSGYWYFWYFYANIYQQMSQVASFFRSEFTKYNIEISSLHNGTFRDK